MNLYGEKWKAGKECKVPPLYGKIKWPILQFKITSPLGAFSLNYTSTYVEEASLAWFPQNPSFSRRGFPTHQFF